MKPDEGAVGFPTSFDRFAPWILGVAIAISAAVTMYLGRGSTFSGDEMVWIVSSPGMDLGTALQSHGGHLQLVPRGIYRMMLETVGLTYWPYRLLTVASMALLSVLLYRYLSRRVGAIVALFPSIMMLFFGADPLHVIKGNGFTIIFSVACGLGALLAVERKDLRGDVVACISLVFGVATYTETLPFVAGITLLLILERSWRRLWVTAVPLALYGGWKFWLTATADEGSQSGIHLSSIPDIPRWIFDALSAILSAITGLGYGFTNLSSSGPNDLIGPLLAALALAAVIWRFSRGSIPRGVWVSLAIGFVLWAIQCLASDPSLAVVRMPDDPRYLYPGAVMVFIIAGDILAGKRWSKAAFAAFAAVMIFGLASNVAQMNEYGKDNRNADESVREIITAAGIYLDEMAGQRVEPNTEPLIISDTGELIGAMAARPFGGIGYSDSEIGSLPESDRTSIDQKVSDYQSIELSKSQSAARHCRALAVDADGVFTAPLPSGTVVLRSGRNGGEATIGRFSTGEPIGVGTVPPDSSRRITTPKRVDGPPWRISFSRPGLKLCTP